MLFLSPQWWAHIHDAPAVSTQIRHVAPTFPALCSFVNQPLIDVNFLQHVTLTDKSINPGHL